MTETVMPKEMIEALKPEYVAPLVAFLAHESFPETGQLFEVGAGYINKLRWQRTKGKIFDVKSITPEEVQKDYSVICDFKDATNPVSNEEMMKVVLDDLE